MLTELFNGIDITDFVGYGFYFLLGFIVLDIVTGLLRAAKDRVLNSSISFEGLIRKLGEIVGVVFATLLDIYLGTDGILTKAGIGGLIMYETISIFENLKQIGVNMKMLMKYLDENKYKATETYETRNDEDIEKINRELQRSMDRNERVNK